MKARGLSRSVPAEPDTPLKGGEGGGTYDGMEARIAKLEAHMEHVQSDLAKLGGLPADIAGMKSDIGNLPTKDYLSQQFDVQFRWIIGVVTMVVAIVGLIVRMTM
jgi:hypothetical protein